MSAKLKKNDIRYAAYPTAQVYGEDGKKQLTQLLWGDWVKITGDEDDGWVPVRVRGHDGWMKTGDLEAKRLLEIVFVDIGVGDGAMVVVPAGRIMLIDAGEADNFYRFLRWRFAGFKNEVDFDTAIISHPDQDHYKGFSKVFEEKNLRFKQVFHNGIMEDTSADGLCAHETVDEVQCITELMGDEADLDAFLADESRWTTTSNGRTSVKQYAKLLKTARDSGRVKSIKMVHSSPAEATYLPGYEEGADVSIRVLGPVPEESADDSKRLRWFKGSRGYDKGKTKNGHSVILKLTYGDVKVMLGGDLNSAAEEYLIKRYSGIKKLPETPEGWKKVRDKLDGVFEADIAKCCHHGSQDFVDGFIACVHPVATVISSGDEESHAHPRSDTLGAIGKNGRGPRPLIFSTELSRSTAPSAKETQRKALREAQKKRDAATTDEERKQAEKEYEEVLNQILGRYVSVYGAINLRSDGKKVVMAYRLEQDRNNMGRLERWDIYRLEPDGNGELVFKRPGG